MRRLAYGCWPLASGSVPVFGTVVLLTKRFPTRRPSQRLVAHGQQRIGLQRLYPESIPFDPARMCPIDLRSQYHGLGGG